MFPDWPGSKAKTGNGNADSILFARVDLIFTRTRTVGAVVCPLVAGGTMPDRTRHKTTARRRCLLGMAGAPPMSLLRNETITENNDTSSVIFHLPSTRREVARRPAGSGFYHSYYRPLLLVPTPSVLWPPRIVETLQHVREHRV